MVGNEKYCFDCGYPALRPRGALARTLYQKKISDRHLAHLDHSQWYSVDESVLQPDVKSLFFKSSLDSETSEFLNKSFDKSDNIFLQIFYSLVKLFLSLFMSQTSINGVLGRGSMFVFSLQQVTELAGYFDETSVPTEKRSLLDLGAGDGSVTRIMEPLFFSVHVTEVSKPMKRQLASKGFTVVDESDIASRSYDMVSCLNVLDRCHKPLTMLKQMRSALKDGGIALVALVLPFSPYVETGSADRKQAEDLNISGSTLEEQVNSLVTRVFPKTGFKVERWTRVPYLCEGDLSQAFYWLDDVVFTLSVDHTDSDNETLTGMTDKESTCDISDIPFNQTIAS